MRFIILLSILSLFALETTQNPSHGKIVSCPILTNSVLRSMKSDLGNENMDYAMCTRLTLYDDEVTNVKGVTEIEFIEDMEKIAKIKEKYNLEIFWAVDAIYRFYDVNFAMHKDFYGSFIAFVKSLNVTGVVLNFNDLKESFLLSSKKDKVLEILKEISKRLKKENIALASSFFLTLDDRPFDKSDFLKYSQHFDFIHSMQFVVDDDMLPFSFEHVLNEVKPSNAQNKIIKFIEWGILPEKIILEVVFGGPMCNIETKAIGFMSYSYICKVMARDKPPKTMHLYDNETDLAKMNALDDENNENQIYYPTSRTIANQIRFAIRHNLAGIFTDLLQNDDVAGNCFADTDTFNDFKLAKGIKLKIPKRKKGIPLIKTINDALIVSVKEFSQMNRVQTNESCAPQGNQSIAAQGNQSSTIEISTTSGTASYFPHMTFVVFAIGLSSVIFI